MRKLVTFLAAIVLVLGLTPALASATAAGEVTTEVQPRLAETLSTGASTDEVRVFVHARDLETAEAAVRDSGLRPEPGFDRFGVAVGSGTVAQVRDVIAHDGVTYVEQDIALTYYTDTSHTATRGEEVLAGAVNDTSYDGSGVSVAIVDSGIDGTHPMFQVNGASKVVRNVKSFCPFLNPVSPISDNIDTCFQDVPGNDSDTPSTGGHGTHVAAIAAGVEYQTADGDIHGAAPGATLVGVSAGQAISVYAGAQGLYWVLEHHEDPCGDGSCPPIKVVNNSWGPDGGGAYEDFQGVLTEVQAQLVAEGVTVVWAAGNNGGGGEANVTNPYAEAPVEGVLSVANYNDAESGTRDGSLNTSSSRGLHGDNDSYPDVSAPGTDITAACRPYLAICNSGNVDDPNVGTISGTSMAAPHVAGIAAQLLEANSNLTPAQIENLLEDTAYDFGDPLSYEADDTNPDSETSYDKGHGLVDVAEAVAQALGTSAPAAPESCTDGEIQVVDPSGDATGVDPQSASANEPNLDVVQAWLDADPANNVTFSIQVTDLRETPPTGSAGEVFYFDFSFDGRLYRLFLNRSVVFSDAALGEIRWLEDVATGATLADDLAGDFDVENDLITAVVPADAFGAGAEITDGSAFSQFAIQAWRDQGAVYFLPDNAGAVCSFTVGGGDTETNTAPEATFTSDTTEPRPTEEITFDASGSSDADGDSLTYSWDLGDGTTTEGQTVTHAYGSTGDYTVTLTVSDGTDAGTDTQTVTVVPNEAPTAVATSDAQRPRNGETVTFSGSGSSDPEGDELAFDWDFGDGGTATGETVTHVYEQPGRYTVTLTVDDGFGGTDTDTYEVIVRGGGGGASNGGQATLAAANGAPFAGGLALALAAIAGAGYVLLRRRLT